MFFIEEKNFLSQSQKDYITKLLSNNNLNYFLSNQQVRENHRFYFTHCLIDRNTHKSLSVHTPFFIEILNFFCNKNNIKINKIFRASINLTTFIDDCVFKPEIHVDHDFDHKQFIMYLNDSDGDTLIFDKEGKNLIKSISPEKYKAICFDSYPHCGLSPSKKFRLIVVITFN